MHIHVPSHQLQTKPIRYHSDLLFIYHRPIPNPSPGLHPYPATERGVGQRHPNPRRYSQSPCGNAIPAQGYTSPRGNAIQDPRRHKQSQQGTPSAQAHGHVEHARRRCHPKPGMRHFKHTCGPHKVQPPYGWHTEFIKDPSSSDKVLYLKPLLPSEPRRRSMGQFPPICLFSFQSPRLTP